MCFLLCYLAVRKAVHRQSMVSILLSIFLVIKTVLLCCGPILVAEGGSGDEDKEAREEGRGQGGLVGGCGEDSASGSI